VSIKSAERAERRIGGSSGLDESMPLKSGVSKLSSRTTCTVRACHQTLVTTMTGAGGSKAGAATGQSMLW
jgi:hypothetical protein